MQKFFGTARLLSSFMQTYLGIVSKLILFCVWLVWQNLGDMALVELGEGCPLLKEIILSHCRLITDVGLSHLVNRCTLLESCHMVYCPGITAAGVATVVASCPSMKKVLVEKSKVSQRTRRRAGSVISYLCVDL